MAPTDRDERQRQLRDAMRSGLPELERSRLRFGKRVVEDEKTGDLFTVCRGLVADAQFSPAVAFYITKQGDPVYLEPAPGAKNSAENLATIPSSSKRWMKTYDSVAFGPTTAGPSDVS